MDQFIRGGSIPGLEVLTETQKISFEDMIKQVNEKYELSNQSSGVETLPWTTWLKNVVQPLILKEAGGDNWQLISQSWKECSAPRDKIENFCGYINLKNTNSKYKLRVSKSDDLKWKVRVVKERKKR